MKKQKKDLIPIVCNYNVEGKKYKTKFNLLNFNNVEELKDGGCELINDKIDLSLYTETSFDEIIKILDKELGDDHYDVFNPKPIRFMILHYLYFENECND